MIEHGFEIPAISYSKLIKHTFVNFSRNNDDGKIKDGLSRPTNDSGKMEHGFVSRPASDGRVDQVEDKQYVDAKC